MTPPASPKDKELKKCRDEAQYDLLYELDRGIHTYHGCQCGRARTRRGTCWICLCESVTTSEEVNQ